MSGHRDIERVPGQQKAILAGRLKGLWKLPPRRVGTKGEDLSKVRVKSHIKYTVLSLKQTEILFTHLLCLGAGNLYQFLFWEIPVCQTCSSTRRKTFIYNSVKSGTKPSH